LGHPDVVLRQDIGAGDVGDDPIVKRAPTTLDLAGMGSDYYLDLPGEQRSAGCDYEHFFKTQMGERSPLVYAHIAAEAEHQGIALQYWFYYVFNRFNNKHESDWEMIQLNFDAPTSTAALTEDPVDVAYAQHGGGEVAKWDDAKLRKDGDHPIVAVAAGSHAAYYGSHTYLGWGENGSGVGCDETTGPSVRTPVNVQLLPDRPEETGPFSWLTFQGLWGAKDSGVFAGPRGPTAGDKWVKPISWQDDLRKGSVALTSRKTIGPKPENFFCQAVSVGADLWTLQKDYAWLTYGLIALLILVPTGLIFLTRRVLGAALLLFARHALLFLGIGGVLIVIGTAVNQIERVVREIPLGDTFLFLLDLFTPAQLIFRTGGSLQQVIGWTLVTPAVIFAVSELQAGRRPQVNRAYRAALTHFWTLFKATARAAVVILALFISIVGIPWAVAKGVRYVFLAQEVTLNHASWRSARFASERAVIGRWWRTAALVAIAQGSLMILAPMVGLLVLIFITPSILIAETVSGVVYALLFPFLGIVMTLWYQQRLPQGELNHDGPSIKERFLAVLPAIRVRPGKRLTGEA
jgi:hypothetical protein